MFDSGFGGLTVARAVIDLLPTEDVVYLGDTGRAPYGPRAPEEVRGFAIEIAEHLVAAYDIKLLVVACNTATVAAIEVLVERLTPLGVGVIGVVEPGVRAALSVTKSGRVGVIGTVGTIASGSYDRSFGQVSSEVRTGLPQRLQGQVDLSSCACPGFVTFVEQGKTEGAQVSVLAERLLAPIREANVDTLLLGCTHYPFLARVIADAVGPAVVLVSSADETAFALSDLLRELDLSHPDSGRVSKKTFITSGDVRQFAFLGARLLGPELIDAESWTTYAT